MRIKLSSGITVYTGQWLELSHSEHCYIIQSSVLSVLCFVLCNLVVFPVQCLSLIITWFQCLHSLFLYHRVYE